MQNLGNIIDATPPDFLRKRQDLLRKDSKRFSCKAALKIITKGEANLVPTTVSSSCFLSLSLKLKIGVV